MCTLKQAASMSSDESMEEFYFLTEDMPSHHISLTVRRPDRRHSAFAWSSDCADPRPLCLFIAGLLVLESSGWRLHDYCPQSKYPVASRALAPRSQGISLSILLRGNTSRCSSLGCSSPHTKITRTSEWRGCQRARELACFLAKCRTWRRSKSSRARD